MLLLLLLSCVSGPGSLSDDGPPEVLSDPPPDAERPQEAWLVCERDLRFAVRASEDPRRAGTDAPLRLARRAVTSCGAVDPASRDRALGLVVELSRRRSDGGGAASSGPATGFGAP